MEDTAPQKRKITDEQRKTLYIALIKSGEYAKNLFPRYIPAFEQLRYVQDMNIPTMGITQNNVVSYNPDFVFGLMYDPSSRKLFPKKTSIVLVHEVMHVLHAHHRRQLMHRLSKSLSRRAFNVAMDAEINSFLADKDPWIRENGITPQLMKWPPSKSMEEYAEYLWRDIQNQKRKYPQRYGPPQQNGQNQQQNGQQQNGQDEQGGQEDKDGQQQNGQQQQQGVQDPQDGQKGPVPPVPMDGGPQPDGGGENQDQGQQGSQSGGGSQEQGSQGRNGSSPGRQSGSRARNQGGSESRDQGQEDGDDGGNGGEEGREDADGSDSQASSSGQKDPGQKSAPVHKPDPSGQGQGQDPDPDPDAQPDPGQDPGTSKASQHRDKSWEDMTDKEKVIDGLIWNEKIDKLFDEIDMSKASMTDTTPEKLQAEIERRDLESKDQGLGTGYDSEFSKVRRVVYPWQTVLENIICTFAENKAWGFDRISYRKPNTRWAAVSEDIVFPNYFSIEMTFNLVVAVDISGSMGRLVKEMYARLKSLTDVISDSSKTWVLEVDTEVCRAVEDFNLDAPVIKTGAGGGTDMGCVGTWVKKQVQEGRIEPPDAVIIMTDNYTGWDPVYPDLKEKTIVLTNNVSKDCPYRQHEVLIEPMEDSD